MDSTEIDLLWFVFISMTWQIIRILAILPAQSGIT